MKIGEINRVKILKISPRETILEDEKGNKVLLPTKEVPESKTPGEYLDVFALSEIEASTKIPPAKINEFAVLKIIRVKPFGAFLEWGSSKDLFVPKSCLSGKTEVGRLLCVYVLNDIKGEGLIGDSRIRHYFKEDVSELKEGKKASLLVYKKIDIGFKVVIDNKYDGLIYANEIYSRVEIGEKYQGFVKKIREDGLIDAALQPQGFPESNNMSEEIILNALKENSGFLPLHDGSDPKLIYDRLGISKKNFKRALGTLYKKEIVVITAEGVKLT